MFVEVLSTDVDLAFSSSLYTTKVILRACKMTIL